MKEDDGKLDEFTRRASHQPASRLGLMLIATLLLALVLPIVFLQVDVKASEDPPRPDLLERQNAALQGNARTAQANLANRTPGPSSIGMDFPERLRTTTATKTDPASRDRELLNRSIRKAGRELERSPQGALAPNRTRSPDGAPRTTGDLPALESAALMQGDLSRGTGNDRLLQDSLPAPSSAPIGEAGRAGPYVLQVLSFRTGAEARRFARALRRRAHPAYVEQADLDETQKIWRVRIGPFENRAKARRYRARFEQRENMPPIVVDNRAEMKD